MKKLFALINTQGKTKEQIVDETWKAFENYSQVEKEVLAKRNKKPYLYAAGFIILALAGYFYYFHADSQVTIAKPQVSVNPTLGPSEMAELKADPNAPEWMKDAESCTTVDGKVFCKLKGE